jgi:hypothetical protein
MTATPDFRYWNSVDPASFLDHDRANPSRAWATKAAAAEAKKGDGTLLEVGPGGGMDYEKYFSKAKGITYTGLEGSQSLHAALQTRFPDAAWRNDLLTNLEPLSADVVYARHVMEHQPALEPALGLVLGAARHACVLTWYRPPGPQAFHEIWEGVYCHTYERAAVLKAVEAAGFVIAKSANFPPEVPTLPEGDEAWLLKRQ